MTPDKLNEFHIKESHMAEGISADFVWYEASIIRNSMQSSLARFDKVVSVMEARHKEHQKMLQDLMDQNRSLVNEVRTLKQGKPTDATK